MYPHWFKHYSHCLVTGTIGSGKTSFLEDCQRDRVMKGQGFCSLIFDQKHYDRLCDYLAYQGVRNVVRLNLSQCDHVVPTNWFSNPATEVGAHAKRIAEAIAGAGQFMKNLQDMQNYSSMMSAVVRWCAEAKKPIQKADWVQFGNQPGILQAATEVTHERTVAELQLIAGITRFADWSFRVGSTWNRLAPFSDSVALRRFTGCEGTLDLQEAVDRNAVILVNLTPHADFTYEAAYIYAALILSQFTLVEGDYYLDLDEAPFYVTYDVCKMLDLMCKKGLRVTLLCHDPRQFEDERIRVSLDINARIRVVFGGMRFEERKKIVADFFPSKLAERWEKERFYSYPTTGYELDPTMSETAGEFGSSITFADRLRPQVERVSSGVLEWSHEEKLSQLAERLVSDKREYLVQLPTGVFRNRVRTLDRFLISDHRRLEFNRHNPQGLTPEQADEQLPRKENHVRRPKTKRTLSPQA
jgi:hypothetical protein